MIVSSKRKCYFKGLAKLHLTKGTSLKGVRIRNRDCIIFIITAREVIVLMRTELTQILTSPPAVSSKL